MRDPDDRPSFKLICSQLENLSSTEFMNVHPNPNAEGLKDSNALYSLASAPGPSAQNVPGPNTIRNNMPLNYSSESTRNLDAKGDDFRASLYGFVPHRP
jgi:hypothetical protein